MDTSCTPSQAEYGAKFQSTSPTVTDLDTQDTVITESSAPFPTERSVARPATGESDTSFSVQQTELFLLHYEEGYDLFDPLYEKWLKLQHPECSWITLLIHHSHQNRHLQHIFQRLRYALQW